MAQGHTLGSAFGPALLINVKSYKLQTLLAQGQTLISALGPTLLINVWPYKLQMFMAQGHTLGSALGPTLLINVSPTNFKCFWLRTDLPIDDLAVVKQICQPISPYYCRTFISHLRCSKRAFNPTFQ
jgi:hypothetical protein